MVSDPVRVNASSTTEARRASALFYIENNEVIRVLGQTERKIRLAEVALIRLCSSGKARLNLELESTDGRKIVLCWSAQDSNATFSLATMSDLIFSVTRRNPFVTYAIGASKGMWIAAWLGLLSSLSVTTLIAWSAFSGRGVPTATLPLAITPVALCIILPILLGGRTQRVSLQTLLNELADYRAQAESFSSRQFR